MRTPRAVNELRNAIQAKADAGKTARQAAEELGVPTGTVSNYATKYQIRFKGKPHQYKREKRQATGFVMAPNAP